MIDVVSDGQRQLLNKRPIKLVRATPVVHDGRCVSASDVPHNVVVEGGGGENIKQALVRLLTLVRLEPKWHAPFGW